MCAIVDANLASHFFGDPVDEELRPFWNWIARGRGALVAGGRNLDELSRVGDASRALRNWERAGRAWFAPHEEVEAETRRVTNQCRSDDPHVIALARVSGARLLCSEDKRLHADFDNRDLINNPRGKVYQDSSHAHLLRSNASWHRHCPHRPAQ